MPIYRDYHIIYRNTNSISPFNIIITHLSKEEEIKLESLKDDNIILVRGNKTFNVSKKKIFCYGDIDFNNEDDIAIINNIKFVNDKPIHLPSDYDFASHECRPKTKGVKYYESWDEAKICKYAYACIGKPNKIILFYTKI